MSYQKTVQQRRRERRKLIYFVFVLILAGGIFFSMSAIVTKLRGGEREIVRAHVKTDAAMLISESGNKTIDQAGNEKTDQPDKAETVASVDENMLPLHITGEVRNPGVYWMKSGQIVANLIERAGGATAAADLSAVNLAEPLVAHGKLVIPAKVLVDAAGANPNFTVTDPGPDDERTVKQPSPISVAQEKYITLPQRTYGDGLHEYGASVSSQNKIDLNEATEAALSSIPGIGSVTAKAIISLREELGGFTAVEQLLEVPGIKQRRFERIAPYVYLP